jgi:hypothetical protein
MGLIMANGSASGVFTKSDSNVTQVTSGRFGVMFHASNKGTLTINEGSVFNTGEAVFMVKSAGPTIAVDNSTLTSANGIILQAMVNDDMGGTGDTANVTFSDMQGTKALVGDIINGMEGTVNVTFVNATITGAITTSTTSPVGTVNQANLQNLSEVTNTYGTTGYAMTASLDGSSTWVVDTTSYLTKLTIASGATVTAPSGKSVTMTVGGVATTIAAGTYSGNIVLTVN